MHPIHSSSSSVQPVIEEIPTIHKLSSEVMFKIFNYLRIEDQDSLCSCKRVCKRWKHLIESTYTGESGPLLEPLTEDPDTFLRFAYKLDANPTRLTQAVAGLISGKKRADCVIGVNRPIQALERLSPREEKWLASLNQALFTNPRPHKVARESNFLGQAPDHLRSLGFSHQRIHGSKTIALPSHLNFQRALKRNIITEGITERDLELMILNKDESLKQIWNQIKHTTQLPDLVQWCVIGGTAKELRQLATPENVTRTPESRRKEPLYYAVLVGDLEKSNILLESGGIINYSRDMLRAAVISGHRPCIEEVCRFTNSYLKTQINYESEWLEDIDRQQTVRILSVMGDLAFVMQRDMTLFYEILEMIKMRKNIPYLVANAGHAFKKCDDADNCANILDYIDEYFENLDFHGQFLIVSALIEKPEEQRVLGFVDRLGETLAQSFTTIVEDRPDNHQYLEFRLLIAQLNDSFGSSNGRILERLFHHYVRDSDSAIRALRSVAFCGAPSYPIKEAFLGLMLDNYSDLLSPEMIEAEFVFAVRADRLNYMRALFPRLPNRFSVLCVTDGVSMRLNPHEIVHNALRDVSFRDALEDLRLPYRTSTISNRIQSINDVALVVLWFVGCCYMTYEMAYSSLSSIEWSIKFYGVAALTFSSMGVLLGLFIGHLPRVESAHRHVCNTLAGRVEPYFR